MLLNGKDIESFYSVYYIDKDESMSRDVSGGFSGNDYISLERLTKGQDFNLKMMIRGADSNEIYKNYFRFVKDLSKCTLFELGFYYDAILLSSSINVIGEDSFSGGYFGMLEVKILVVACYEDYVTPSNISNFVSVGLYAPATIIEVKNVSGSTKSITVAGLLNQCGINNLPNGSTAIIDGKNKTIKVDDVSSVAMFTGYAFPSIKPDSRISIATSPSTGIELSVKYYPRWY